MLSSSINKILDMDKEIRGSSVKLEDLPKDKTVIVVVDMVNGFVHQGLLSSPRILTIIGSISGLLKQGRGLQEDILPGPAQRKLAGAQDLRSPCFDRQQRG